MCWSVTRQFSSLGGLLFGYDQGVVSGILTMESFGVAFPRIYLDSGFKGWFVSTLLLSNACSHPQLDITSGWQDIAAWLGSLANGPIADSIGRKRSILVAVVIFLIGSAIQAGAVNIPMIFVGKSIRIIEYHAIIYTRWTNSLYQGEQSPDWQLVYWRWWCPFTWLRFVLSVYGLGRCLTPRL